MTTKMPLQSPSSGANRVAKRPQFNSTVSTPVKNAIPFVANHGMLGHRVCFGHRAEWCLMSVESNNQVRDLIGQAIDNGRYIIERLIGQGGMGQVYEARQVSMGRQVAIKILHMNLTNNEELISRFETEALSISRLNHPNIITIYDYGRTEDGMLFMVMELLQGATLDRVIRREQGVTQPRGLTLMRQVANAVSEAHRLGVVHRDLKQKIFIFTVSLVSQNEQSSRFWNRQNHSW